ncbi:MAG: DUF4118 domain-containing protein [Lachnospiraceae bacterium]|nr:DUF4118 domain-containing protein [Lachnospiraceae bacterium]
MKYLFIKNLLTTTAILACATTLCLILNRFSPSDTHVPLVFVLAVLFVSRFTDGYVYGIVSSMVAVAGVNYVFTYPYFELNFTLTGYSITFGVMLAVACSVSAMTTRIKKQEEVWLEAEKEKMRGNLLRAVSHDIRTPLTSIVASASGIIENYDMLTSENRLELVKDIRAEAQWLIRIVENLLSITRIGEDGARIDKQEELAEEIISSAVVKFKKRFPEIRLSVKLPQEVVLVPMDGILIEQVLVNLLENAVLHGHGTTEITIIVENVGEMVSFAVEDNGQGIRESLLPRLFEGTLQSESERTSDSKRNMGIGLSVCMSIVRAHKGNMAAENRKTGGARVSFWLPKE